MSLLNSKRVTTTGVTAVLFDPQGQTTALVLRVVSGGPIDIGGQSVTAGNGFNVTATDVPLILGVDGSEVIYAVGNAVVAILYTTN